MIFSVCSRGSRQSTIGPSRIWRWLLGKNFFCGGGTGQVGPDLPCAASRRPWQPMSHGRHGRRTRDPLRGCATRRRRSAACPALGGGGEINVTRGREEIESAVIHRFDGLKLAGSDNTARFFPKKGQCRGSNRSTNVISFLKGKSRMIDHALTYPSCRAGF